jgi:hypothetical protein
MTPTKVSGFTQIQNSFIRDETISAKAKTIGMIYASYAGKDSIVFPGIKLLMALSKLDRDAVTAGRAELVKRGHLKKLIMKNEKGQYSRVRYQVNATLLVPRTTENLFTASPQTD